ncbi:MAG: hypothetical protein WB676_17635 [Bryobacteraceae bacterium]
MPRAPSLEMGVVVYFSDVFGRTPTLEEARATLAQYTRESVLLVLAKLSAALQLWFRPDYNKDNGLARDVFRNAAKVINQFLPGRPPRFFFSRLGILATARLALTVCNDEHGRNIREPTEAAHILCCCLMMNELTVKSGPVSTATDMLLHQLPNHNGLARYDFRADLLRSLSIFERNRDLIGTRAGIVDLELEFADATGLAARRFAELCLVVGAPYRAITAASLVANDPTFLVDKTRFANMTVSDETLSSFFGTVARTPQELTDFLSTQKSRPLADTTVFQSWPMIQVPRGGQYYCLDVASLMDKTGRGLYWTLFGAADKSTKAKLGGTYGVAFEAYLHDRVRATGISAEVYLASPQFPSEDEVTDAIFVEGAYLVLCEYKSSVLRADAKLGGQLDQLVTEIDKKFITGDEDGRKGIAQLHRSIRRVLQGEPIVGLPERKWTKILAVMICLEHAMLCPGMSAYLNERFDRTTLKALSSTAVGPLVLIDVEHFEDLLPDIKQYTFTTLLDDYYRNHMRATRDQLVPFRRANIPFLDDKPKPPDNKEAEFRKFFAGLGTRLFGEQS